MKKWLFSLLVLFASITACVCIGSVMIPPQDALQAIRRAVLGLEQISKRTASIIVSVRLPHVLCAALSGSALSLSGAAMQGLLRNPLADGSTLGVSSGAALGAVLAIMLGISFPQLPFSGTMIMASLFAFGTMLLLILISWSLDHSLATHSIVLVGIVFSMFAGALMNLLITFSGDKLKNITFWTMGSFASASYANCSILAIVLVICGIILMLNADALNAFALGEEQALHIGVSVQRVKLTVMAAVSVLIGVCVSIGGSIGFVGLVAPQIMQMLTGSNHRVLLPASAIGGAVFLLWCDLCARTLLSPLVLPVGTVTSLIGAVFFVVIFCQSRRGGRT